MSSVNVSQETTVMSFYICHSLQVLQDRMSQSADPLTIDAEIRAAAVSGDLQYNVERVSPLDISLVVN